MGEQSGIDMLELILSKLERLEKHILILDQNIKKVANSAKVGELMERAQAKPAMLAVQPTEPKSQTGITHFKFEPSDASKLAKGGPEIMTAKRNMPRNVMVKGKMVSVIGDKVTPLIDVVVKIYNTQNILVKETKTNRGGLWLCHLSQGKYVAELTGKHQGIELIPQNKAFEVPEGVTEFEVK